MQTDTKNSDDPEVEQAIKEKLKEIFGLVMSKYEPATDKSSADEFRTSDQIYSQIFDVYPSEDFQRDNIYDLMKEAGYKVDTVGDDTVTFYWLLKSRR